MIAWVDDACRDGQAGVLTLRCRYWKTDGHGKRWLSEPVEHDVPANYWKQPFPSEAAHFHGSFGVMDNMCCCLPPPSLATPVAWNGKPLNGEGP